MCFMGADISRTCSRCDSMLATVTTSAPQGDGCDVTSSLFFSQKLATKTEKEVFLSAHTLLGDGWVYWNTERRLIAKR